MTTTTIAGRPIDVNEEGFLVDSAQWDDQLGTELAHLIGVELTDEHWKVLRFLRDDFTIQGETATLRRTSLQTGKPAKKMAYVAGLPKPKGCV